ncbi:hypothetical protein E5676_scaffold1369G00070 [Cucumis melo var. makuwa]|uniref:Uncharacterized protein n=1 Tax=Cucumis melo var. makuwa TaxID=1194695 RepID=A0A5D3BWY0_CUCMM|nr:hypothetical protein E5676_scaffold1369G00070 [Cucumis melo var. makuwa]
MFSTSEKDSYPPLDSNVGWLRLLSVARLGGQHTLGCREAIIAQLPNLMQDQVRAVGNRSIGECLILLLLQGTCAGEASVGLRNDNNKRVHDWTCCSLGITRKFKPCSVGHVTLPIQAIPAEQDALLFPLLLTHLHFRQRGRDRIFRSGGWLSLYKLKRPQDKGDNHETYVLRRTKIEDGGKSESSRWCNLRLELYRQMSYMLERVVSRKEKNLIMAFPHPILIENTSYFSEFQDPSIVVVVKRVHSFFGWSKPRKEDQIDRPTSCSIRANTLLQAKNLNGSYKEKKPSGRVSPSVPDKEGEIFSFEIGARESQVVPGLVLLPCSFAKRLCSISVLIRSFSAKRSILIHLIGEVLDLYSLEKKGLERERMRRGKESTVRLTVQTWIEEGTACATKSAISRKGVYRKAGGKPKDKKEKRGRKRGVVSVRGSELEHYYDFSRATMLYPYRGEKIMEGV